ncbi:hypothetical protein GCM10010495_73490 [Kitasatospora herbaricolor]|uniref:hypothetical protein n=1 Tax=Kitasatospora herbaricolor TaxID=68217 RepID=UPI00174A468B|nr:hypothetical protein [Kitasatospora herbaricolor]MDQ0309409.1 hypothetical protein [Kitasatospora herbaricolor]GGV45219.1 hypothetical protein GCM10010495_73490 [Kitasatospora herbaricolor]
MRSIVAGQRAANENEFAELALGVDEELFAGVAGEDEMDRAARLDAAYGVLADLRREDPELAAYAERLLKSAPVPLRRVRAVAPAAVVPVGVAA